VVNESRVRGALNLIASRRLTGRECRILCVILERTAGGEPLRRITSGEIAARTGLRDWHVRTLVGQLEKKQLVYREPDGIAYRVGLVLNGAQSKSDIVPRTKVDVSHRDEAHARMPRVAEVVSPIVDTALPDDLLRQQAERTHGSPPREPSASEMIVSLGTMTGDDPTAHELAERLEASGALGADLLRRMVDDLRALPRSESGLLLTADGPQPATELARAMLRGRLRAVEALN
jgi:hypothetical protein